MRRSILNPENTKERGSMACTGRIRDLTKYKRNKNQRDTQVDPEIKRALINARPNKCTQTCCNSDANNHVARLKKRSNAIKANKH